MRLRPVQFGMRALLGEWLPMGMPRDQLLVDRIRAGHDFLVKLTSVDLGYDPQAWHDFLRENHLGDYFYGARFQREIEAATVNPDWQAAVADLLREQLADKHTSSVEQLDVPPHE